MPMKYRIDRTEIIRKRGALIRMGSRLAAVSTEPIRIRERRNRSIHVPTVSTTFKSPLISGIYQSVFAKGEKQDAKISR